MTACGLLESSIGSATDGKIGARFTSVAKWDGWALRMANGKVNMRTEIVGEATRLFGARGYTGTSMRDIASAVGLLPGSLYAHIDSKDSILLEIVESGIDRFLALGFAAIAGPESAEVRLRRLIEGHVAIVAQNADRTLVVFHQWRYLRGESFDRVVDKRRQYEAVIREVVADGVREGVFSESLDIKVTVLSILGALNWTAEWYKPEGPESAQELASRMANFVLDGLRNR